MLMHMKTKLQTLSMAVMASFLFAGCDYIQGDATHVVPAVRKPVPIAANINDMKWLVGRWENVSLEARYFETWKEVNETTMYGESGSITGTDTVIDETISLEQRGNDLLYIPTVKNQNDGQPVSFKLAAIAGNSFVFENPEHDFPQKITYMQKPSGILLAKISGKMNGKPHTAFFPMNKVQ